MATSEGGAGNHNLGQVYRCFLVRCRLEEGAGRNREASWRFTVQEPGTHATRHSFACLKHVEAYLEAELEACDKQLANQYKESRRNP